MDIILLSGTANRSLAEGVGRELDTRLSSLTIERFPDGEVHVLLQDSVRDADVYVVQPTHAPVGEHTVELLLIADACRRAGAARVTALVPYFGYARQDRRAQGRDALGARVMADMLGARLFDRILAMDLHTPALEGFFAVPLEHLTAVPLLADAVRAHIPGTSVVVSPDLGAVKLAEQYARLLGLPMAIVHKTRLTAEEVQVRRVVGEVRGMAPLIVDDMVSTGGTVEAAVQALLDAGCEHDVTVVASHGLFVGRALERLTTLPVRRVVVTDSVPPRPGPPDSITVVSIAPLLADAVRRLHAGRSLFRLRAHA